METCVLIPHEFALFNNAKHDECSGNIILCTTTDIPKGKLFYPFQGTVRTDVLDCIEYFTMIDDIRSRFGLYDEISNIRDRKVRNCNWIRFLKISTVYCRNVNLMCTKMKGIPIYETIKSISINQELLVYYLPQSIEDRVFTEMRSSLYRQTMELIFKETPLDLSKVLVCRRMIQDSFSNDDNRQIPSHYSDKSSASLEESIEHSIPIKTRMRLFSVKSTKVTTKRVKTLLPCNCCGKSFDRPSLLKRHMRIHTGEKPHICQTCGKAFSTSSSLNTHRRIHTGEKPHECQVCRKRFTASSNLYYHRMTHLKEKPHKCDLCSKSFATPGDLKSHLYIHSGSWPFQCHICSRGFAKQTSLKSHKLLHTDNLTLRPRQTKSMPGCKTNCDAMIKEMTFNM